MKKVNLLSKSEMKSILGGSSSASVAPPPICLHCRTAAHGDECFKVDDTSGYAIDACAARYSGTQIGAANWFECDESCK